MNLHIMYMEVIYISKLYLLGVGQVQSMTKSNKKIKKNFP